MEDSTVREPAMPDSTLMDTNMDADMDANMDDLFGEAADGLTVDGLSVPLPPALVPAELGLRIVHMQSRGCCT